MVKTGFIYKITSPSGKIYIGQTRNFHKRFNDYKKYNAEGQGALNNSFKKYGFDAHIIEIIEEVSLTEILEREIQVIKEYNSVRPNGLNIHKGGKGGFAWNDKESREKMMVMLKDRKGHKNPNFKNHFKHTEEAIQKMKAVANSQNRKGGQNNHAKGVINETTGEIFSCAREAAKKYGKSECYISHAIRRNFTTIGSFKYLETA